MHKDRLKILGSGKWVKFSVLEQVFTTIQTNFSDINIDQYKHLFDFSKNRYMVKPQFDNILDTILEKFGIAVTVHQDGSIYVAKEKD